MTRDEAVAEMGAMLRTARQVRDEMTPRDAAVAAHVPGGATVETLEARIREDRRVAAVGVSGVAA